MRRDNTRRDGVGEEHRAARGAPTGADRHRFTWLSVARFRSGNSGRGDGPNQLASGFFRHDVGDTNRASGLASWTRVVGFRALPADHDHLRARALVCGRNDRSIHRGTSLDTGSGLRWTMFVVGADARSLARVGRIGPSLHAGSGDEPVQVENGACRQSAHGATGSVLGACVPRSRDPLRSRRRRGDELHRAESGSCRSG